MHTLLFASQNSVHQQFPFIIISSMSRQDSRVAVAKISFRASKILKNPNGPGYMSFAI